MKIIYSPYFDGRYYCNLQTGVLKGVKVAGTNELLSEIELRAGMSHSEKDISEERVAAYHSLLKECIKEGSLLYESFAIDSPSDNSCHVTEMLLKWRDILIMSGWKGEDLPGEKLSVLSSAERLISSSSIVRMGEADRWMALKNNAYSLKALFDIDVRCPKSLIPSVVVDVITEMGASFNCELPEAGELKVVNPRILTCNDITEAYEWIAMSDVKDGQMVVCNDTERMDSVLKSLHKSKVGDAQVGCHNVANDVRGAIDTPYSLVWIDCNGTYGSTYPYSFISKSEYVEINRFLSIPAEDTMLTMVQNHLYSLLNEVKGECIFIKAESDCGSILPEHPIITSLIRQGVKAEPIPAPDFAMKDEEKETRFTPNVELTIEGCDLSRRNRVTSSSSLENILNNPFDYVTERIAGLYEPDKIEDLQTELGNIAHKAVELMTINHSFRKDCIEQYVEQAVDDKGNLVIKPENSLVLDKFKEIVTDSITTLIDIIEKNNLEAVYSEMHIPAEDDETSQKEEVYIDGIGKCKGIIDFVLRRDNDYFIIDFKYSTSDRYKQKLMHNTSVQFELYRRMFDQYGHKGKVKAMGYYLFPLKTLFMSDSDYLASGFRGENIEPVSLDRNSADFAEDGWREILTRFSERSDELRKGVIGADKEKPYKEMHIVLKNKIR